MDRFLNLMDQGIRSIWRKIEQAVSPRLHNEAQAVAVRFGRRPTTYQMP